MIDEILLIVKKKRNEREDYINIMQIIYNICSNKKCFFF